MHLAVSLPISIPAVGNRQPAFENQLLAKEISIDKEGFLYIFVANGSPYPEISVGVWFEDITVEVTKSPVAAVSDYYPFGMLQEGNSTGPWENFKLLKIVGIVMDLHAKKLYFIREILSIENVAILDKLEEVLKREKQQLDPALKEKLTSRALKAENDIANGRTMTREEIEKNLKDRLYS